MLGRPKKCYNSLRCHFGNRIFWYPSLERINKYFEIKLTSRCIACFIILIWRDNLSRVSNPDPDPTSQDKPNPDPKPCATVYHSFILSRLFTILLTNMDLYLDGKQPCCEYVCQAKNELYLLAISLLFIKLSSWCKFVCKIWDSGIREI